MDTKFKNAFILSGGGMRLMIYLGMYAALEKLKLKPDVLIATCGGAFAATVINTFSDNDARKAYLKSEEYFQFITKKRLTEHKKLSKIGLLAFKKILNKGNAPFIEDVFNCYLSDMPQNPSEDLPTLKSTTFSKEIPTLIIGSKILFNQNEIGQKRNNKKLYQKVIFTDTETATKIDVEKTTILSENYNHSTVTKTIKIETNQSMLTSSRVSISDMFYVAPVYLENNYFAGGAIDLIPIELAKHLANSVIIEEKQSYSTVEEAFVRSVLGYSGNRRLAEIQKHAPDYQIDTKNIKKELEGHYIKKKINWKTLEMDFEFPKSYKQFKEDMDMQWNYGFQQTIKSIKE